MRVFVYLNLLFVFSCAQPKYIQWNTPTEKINEQQKLTADCSLQFNNYSLCLSWQFTQDIQAQQNLVMIVKIYRPNLYDQTVVYENIPEGVTLQVKLWMSSMGHGSVPTQVKKIDTGTYEVSRVNFIMSGPWQVYFNILGNNVNDQIRIDLDVP
ncbi:MAG: FixH family protein [Pseudobdellovibrio sp.]